MLKKVLFIFMTIGSTIIYAQVGIATETPTATLDVNGDLRIRSIVEELDLDLVKDSILVISRDGVVKRVPSKIVISSALKTAVRGGFSGTGSLNLSLGLGTTYTNIPFDNEDFDYNDEYDVVTGQFTAKQDGIYDISVQINSSGGLSASTNYGVCVLKNGTVISKENFANINISVLAINLNVTPPIRKSNTLVQLNTGDTISFQIFSDLLSVDLSKSPEDSFFTIVQIR